MIVDMATVQAAGGLGAAWWRGAPAFAEVREYQNRALRAMVRHAGTHVPFYRELYRQAGIDVRSFHGLEDIGTLPVVTRRELQLRSPQERLAEGYKRSRLLNHWTTGTLGEPLLVCRTGLEERLMQLLRVKAMVDLGMRLTDRRVQITSMRERKTLGPDDPMASLRTRAGLAPMYHVDMDHSPQAAIKRLHRLQPNIIGGIAGRIARVADHMTPRDRERIHLRFLSAGAETASPEIRRRIEQGFGAPLRDCYGSCEFNLISSECPKTGLRHINQWGVVAEVLRDGQPVREGESGTMVLTSLHSRAMPFIRYDLGDEVTLGPSPCPCGAPYPTLAAVRRRIAERFRHPRGGEYHPFMLIGQIGGKALWVGESQFEQERLDHVVVRIVPLRPDDVPPDGVAWINKALTAYTGPEVTFRIEIVPAIATAPSGKRRLFISLPEN